MKLEFGIDFRGAGCCYLDLGDYFLGFGFDGSTMIATPARTHLWMHPSSAGYGVCGSYRKISWR